MNFRLPAAAVLASVLAAPVGAVELAANAQWQAFDIDELSSVDGGLGFIDLEGNPLVFTFTLNTPGILRVVDAGFGGDRFQLTTNGGGTVLGLTSPVANPDVQGASVVQDFDLAFADHTTFSFAEILLAPGAYDVSGSLIQSAVFDGVALNATLGAVQLTAVPLPASAVLLLGASSLLGLCRRRSA